jgi:hypothetical protein
VSYEIFTFIQVPAKYDMNYRLKVSEAVSDFIRSKGHGRPAMRNGGPVIF